MVIRPTFRTEREGSGELNKVSGASRHAVHHPQHISWIDFSNTGASQRKTAGKNTLPNLPSIAPKQDEICVPDMRSSCVHGTLSNLLLKLLRGKRCMDFGFCCIYHFSVAIA